MVIMGLMMDLSQDEALHLLLRILTIQTLEDNAREG